MLLDVGWFIGADGRPSRTTQVDWPAPPEDICRCSVLYRRYEPIPICSEAFVKPYIFGILPAGTVPIDFANISPSTHSSQASFHPSPVLQIRSSLSLLPSQTLPFPFRSTTTSAPAPQYTLRLLVASPAEKTPLFLVSTPADRATANLKGSSIWQFQMKSWGEQVDELVGAELYLDALALLETIDPTILPDKVGALLLSLITKMEPCSHIAGTSSESN